MSRNSRQCAESDLQLIFIVGLHRSGTSILYRILAASGCFNVVTAFHILNRRRLLHLYNSGALPHARAEMVTQFASADFMDEYGRPITPDTLEEYGFALDYSFRRPVLTKGNLSGFVEFCQETVAVQDPEKPLLLKNPFDAANFIFLRESFPNARFIFICRHPAWIIDSQIRLLRQMMNQRLNYDAMLHRWYRQVYDNPIARVAARCAFSEHLPVLFHLVASSVSGSCDYITDHRDELGGSAIEVTYVQLCEDPAEVAAKVLNALDLTTAEPHGRFISMVKPRERTLLPEVERRLVEIEARNQSYRRKFQVTTEYPPASIPRISA